MEKNKMVKVTIEVPQSEISLLRRRFKRQQEKNPHPLHPELTDEWVVKMCFFESKSLEHKEIVKNLNRLAKENQKFLKDVELFEKRSMRNFLKDKIKVK